MSKNTHTIIFKIAKSFLLKKALDNKENSISEFFINNVLTGELLKINQANDVLQTISLGAKKNYEIVSQSYINSSEI